MNFIASAFKSDKIELSMDDIDLLLSGHAVDGPGVSIVYTGKTMPKTKPSPTVEISLEDAKRISGDNVDVCDIGRYERLNKAIFKAEGKEEPVLTPLGELQEIVGKNVVDVERLKTAVSGLQNDRSNIITVLNRAQDRISNLEDRLSPVSAKAEKGIDYLKQQRDSAIKMHFEYKGSCKLDVLYRQVQAMNESIAEIRNTISQLQRVIEGMKGKSI